MTATDDLHFHIEPLEIRCYLSGAATTAQSTYEPGTDSLVGFNMVSFSKQRGKQARNNWANGVQSLHENAVQHVTINVYKEVRFTNGRVLGGSGTGNDVLRTALEQASELGMSVTLNPIFEVVGGNESWRGAFDPSDADRGRFQRSYRAWVKKLAKYAQRYEVERLGIGSELVAMVGDSDNHDFFSDVIAVANEGFEGQIGYGANWNNLDNSVLAATIWDNPMIDYLGISAYFSDSLAVVDQEAAENSHTNPNFVDEVTAGWNAILDNIVLPVAAAAQNGAGLPVVIQEFGAVPYDLTSQNPWATNPSEYVTGIPGETIDAAEQTAMLVGLLYALDGRGSEIAEVHFWTWTFEGNPADTFGLGPNSAPEAQMATNAILSFVQSA